MRILDIFKLAPRREFCRNFIKVELSAVQVMAIRQEPFGPRPSIEISVMWDAFSDCGIHSTQKTICYTSRVISHFSKQLTTITKGNLSEKSSQLTGIVTRARRPSGINPTNHREQLHPSKSNTYIDLGAILRLNISGNALVLHSFNCLRPLTIFEIRPLHLKLLLSTSKHIIELFSLWPYELGQPTPCKCHF